MSNFEKDLKEFTDNELRNKINSSNPVFGSLCSDELTRRALNKLQETIQVFNSQSSKQTQKMIDLTGVIVVLTVAMLVGLAVQISLGIKQTTYTEIQSRADRLQQTMDINRAIEICEQNPELEQSSLVEVLNGNPISCKQVLQIYKK